MGFKIHHGHTLAVLRSLPEKSVQCCVTSPPYWGLRDYKSEPQVWGGEQGHEHEWGVQRRVTEQPGPSPTSTLRGNGHIGGGPKLHRERGVSETAFCVCGAWRGALGSEPTPAMYTENIVAIFREVRRVLRDDATVWLNLGDSYASTVKGSGGTGKSTLVGTPNDGNGQLFGPCRMELGNLKPKDLVGIPWRVAFALQADGWWLRSEIIWHKPNQMPSSVTDRPTRDHEQVFLLTKAARYYYDADAIAEPAANAGLSVSLGDRSFAKRQADGKGVIRSGNANAETYTVKPTRNKRSVWTITTKPYKGAHFAVFPEALVEPCVLAGSKEGDCVLDPFCGSGTVGVVALRHNRRFIGIDLNPEYAKMARGRIEESLLAAPD